MPTTHDMLSTEHYSGQARLKKCQAIVRKVVEDAATLLEGLTTDEWTQVAAGAGQHRPSEESQKLIISMVRGLK